MIHYDTLELQPLPLGAGFEAPRVGLHLPELDLELPESFWSFRGDFAASELDLELPKWFWSLRGWI